jgi:hypothetical protein
MLGLLLLLAAGSLSAQSTDTADPLTSRINTYLKAWDDKDYATMKECIYPGVVAQIEKLMTFEQAMGKADEYFKANNIVIQFSSLKYELIGDDIVVGSTVFHKATMAYVMQFKGKTIKLTGYLVGIHEAPDAPWYIIEDNEKMYDALIDKYPSIRDQLPVDQSHVETVEDSQ